jgi:hypothetical protein
MREITLSFVAFLWHCNSSQPLQATAVTMLSLHEKFVLAEKSLNESTANIPDNLRLKLYGLSKQAKEGDCRMPMPPP